MEDMITFSRKPLHSFMCIEFLHTDVAPSQSQVSVSFKEDHCLNLSKVLVIVAPNHLQLRWHLMTIVCNYHLLVLDIVDYSSLHEENTIFVKSSDKFLSSVNFLLHVSK